MAAILFEIIPIHKRPDTDSIERYQGVLLLCVVVGVLKGAYDMF